jgi:RNA polymerase sigma factor (sigma-70 family)
MARGPLAGVIPRMPLAALGGHAAGDAELLARFVAARDGDAFELLVRRHGPMVLAVCLRLLRNRADAEDAFQATFLVLAHKAAAVSPPGRLAGWLHGVAHKTALKARHRAARRAAAERLAPARSTQPMPPEPDRDEVESLLDQELAALPERYRLPIVLCDLEGRRRTEAAAALGCPEGTLSARLTRGRRLLADRLRRRGVLLSAAALATVLAGRPAALAEPLVRATVPAALHAVSAPGTAAGAASPSVATLATGVMKSMFLKKLQAVAVVALVAAASLAALAGLDADRSSAATAAKAAPVPAAADDKATIEALADMDGQLLMNRKVLKDLRCDFDQFDKIMDAMEVAQKRAQEKTTEAMAQLRANPGANPGPDGFRKMVAEAQEVGAKELNKAAVGVVATLTPTQRKRLREIDLQARGHEAFTTPAVAKALDLNAKHKEQLAANAKQVEEDVARATQRPAPVAVRGPGAPGGVATASFSSADFEKAVRDARAEGLKRALAVLTDEQKAEWKKLTGEPFAYPLDRPPRSTGIGFGGAGPAPRPPAAPGANGAPGTLPPPPANPPAEDPGN